MKKVWKKVALFLLLSTLAAGCGVDDLEDGSGPTQTADDAELEDVVDAPDATEAQDAGSDATEGDADAAEGGDASGAGCPRPLSVTASDDDGNVAENVLDDDPSTRWSAEGDGVWIRFDFGEKHLFETVELAWYKGDERTSDFSVQVSVDGNYFHTLERYTSSGQTLDAETYQLPEDAIGRYLRIVGHGNSESSWNSITHFSACGEPTDREPGYGPPTTDDWSLEPNPNFDISMLDDTVQDQLGYTPRDYYQMAIGGLSDSHWDDIFDRPSNRPANRQGNLMLTSAGVLYRRFGDLRILDRAIELIDLWGARRVTKDGHTYWEGYDQDLDTPLATGLISMWAYAALEASGVDSPAGHNYAAWGAEWRDWLEDDFKPRWEEIEGTQGEVENNQRPFINKTQQHTWANQMRTLWYLGKMGAKQAYLDTVTWMLSDKLSRDIVCNEGWQGRPTRIYSHCNIDSGSDNCTGMQYRTYVAYDLIAYLDLHLENADPRLDQAFFESFAHSFADFVLDGDPDNTGDELAQMIGGDVSERCGRHGSLGYRSRVSISRAVRRTYGFFSGWDSRRKIRDTILQAYPNTSSTSRLVAVKASRVFDFYYHGASAY